MKSFPALPEPVPLARFSAADDLRAAKLPHGVPKPLSVADAAEMIDAPSALVKSAWQAKRDVAVLTLLYGCGLRISEALGLKRSEAPQGEPLMITGKGQKQ